MDLKHEALAVQRRWPSGRRRRPSGRNSLSLLPFAVRPSVRPSDLKRPIGGGGGGGGDFDDAVEDCVTEGARAHYAAADVQMSGG